MSRTNAVGIGLILGAAVGFALGLITAQPAMAPIFGAVGAGLGIVAGAIMAATWSVRE